MSISRFLPIFLLLGCSSYGTDPQENALPNGNAMNGTYTWVRSVGGFAGVTHSPASQGYTVRFTFAGNKVSVLRNDSLKGTHNFTLQSSALTYDPAINVFLFDPQITQQNFRVIKGDTIALADPCCDRFDHVFVRAP